MTRRRPASLAASLRASLAASLVASLAVGCSASPAPAPQGAGRAGSAAEASAAAPSSAGAAAVSPSAPATTSTSSAPPAPPASSRPRRWLRGSTHVHARPSGDSSTEISDVIAWYERHGYDFIALTDHNRVSELTPQSSTLGAPAVRGPAQGLIVLAGIELTHNPGSCWPAPPTPSGKCRIHVNALGVTARPIDRLEWAERRSTARLDQYTRALQTAGELGGVAQLNHPQWHWGMSAELLTELARRGARLVEIANVQFASWNAGDGVAPSMEALWDAALASGVDLWAVASDDAHSYDVAGPYPAGGGWVMVQAEREPASIVAALAAGRFYASTGVSLARAEQDGADLVVEISPQSEGRHRIAFYENGAQVAEADGPVARRAVPARGYVRAVVTRHDGAKAWVQPARRAPR